jgi:hypothetical protein
VCSTLDIVENFEIEFEQIDVEGEYMSILIADLLGNTISVCITNFQQCPRYYTLKVTTKQS